MNLESIDINSVEIEQIEMNDFPDFCDAFISTANFKDGTELTEKEVETLNDEHYGLINELIHDKQLYI